MISLSPTVPEAFALFFFLYTYFDILQSQWSHQRLQIIVHVPMTIAHDLVYYTGQKFFEIKFSIVLSSSVFILSSLSRLMPIFKVQPS